MLAPLSIGTLEGRRPPFHATSNMKKRKRGVSKKEAVTISSTTSTKAPGENTGHIPTDILLEILSRLPAKSVARFRCVSTDWDSILCRQDFTDLFLKMSSRRPRLLFTFQAEGKWSSFSLPEILISNQSSPLVVVDSHPHVPRDYAFGVCRPANGFLCTKDEWAMSRKKDARMTLCNPSTGRFISLPKVRSRRGRVMTYFGYDPVEKLYKVLCMTACERPYMHKAEQHQVLTLGTGRMNWRMIECSVSYFPQNQDNEICINGVIYYLAVASGAWSTSMIVCFDVRFEKLKFIVDDAFNDLRAPSTLINYKGKLGILHPKASGYISGRSSGFELWVIDDTEKEKPTWWRQIHIFPSLWQTIVDRRLHIVGTTVDSVIVFAPYVVSYPFYIFCYNMERKTVTRVEIKGFGPVTDQCIYTYLSHMENLKFIT